MCSAIVDSIELGRRAIERTLKSRRNTLAPIAKLPFELLTLVFGFIVMQSRDSCALRPVIHVCQFWRQTALNCAVLWTHVTGSKFSLQIASRSKDVPLHVLLTRELDQRLSQLVVQFVFANVHRIQEIRFDVPVPLLKELLQSLSGSALLLEAAEIICRDSVVRIDFSGLTRCHVPRMRQLSLEAVDITWDEWFVRNLTSLILRSVPLDVTQLPTILRTMPKLQVLRISEDPELEDPLPHLRGFSSADNPVHLQNLSDMTFVGPFSNCLFLMTHLIFPPSTSITAGAWMAIHALPNLVALLMQRLFRVTNPSLHFTASVAGLKFATPSRVLEMIDLKNLESCLEAGFHHFRTSSSVHIALSNALPAGEHCWATALGRMERLTFLTLTLNDSGEVLLRALTRFSKSRFVSNPTSTIMLSGLEQLTVHVALEPEVEDRFSVLHRFLQTRNEIGAGIMQVNIVMRKGDPRPLSAADLDQLRDLVDVLEWEEREGEDGPV